MGRRYASLEGREVDFRHDDGRVVRCVVTGADWSLGLTVQQVGDNKHYVYCINGPKSPIMKGQRFNYKLHCKTMAYIYDCVMNKQVLKTTKLIALHKSYTGWNPGSHPSAETCAFSQ